jgi:hypothetical protein
MNTYAGDRCGAEGIAVIRDRCSEISDTKVRIADEADWCDCSFGFTALLCERT